MIDIDPKFLSSPSRLVVVTFKSRSQTKFFRLKFCVEVLKSSLLPNLMMDSKGGQVGTFILDFEKAFDTPPHELLKCKLFGYGIRGKTLLWIDSL